MPKPLPIVAFTALALLSHNAPARSQEVLVPPPAGVGPSYQTNGEADCEDCSASWDEGCAAPVDAWARSCCGCGRCTTGFWRKWHCGTCAMPPHYAYFPQMHGYYYFRPYHPSHVALHRDMARQWGGDPRNPYDNAIFQQVYRDHEAARNALPEE
jgi:hypothetical protein